MEFTKKEFPEILESIGHYVAGFLHPEPVGAPILLMHEALGSVDIWKRFPEELGTKTGRSVYAYDRLGHGRSNPIDGPRPFDYLRTYTENALQVIDILRNSESTPAPVLFGHSDGATLALMCAIERDDFPALIIEAPHSYVDTRTRHGVGLAGKPDFRQPLCEKLYKFHGREKTEWLYDNWINVWSHPDFAGCEIRDKLEKITAPVLGIQGDLDEYCLPDQLTILDERCSGPVETHLLPDCFHIPHIEYKDKVLELTGDFLTRKLNNR